jgi:DNA-binding MarR family transcriptional regulator
MNQKSQPSSLKKSSTSQEDKTPVYIHAIRFNALQDYFNGSLTENGIKLLEYLIMVGAHWLNKKQDRFFHSKATIKKRTGISSNTATALIRDFEKDGFLVTEVVHEHGRPITYFRMKFARIANSLGILFGGEEVKHTPAQLARIEQRQQALRHMARAQMELKKRQQKLLAK